MRLRNIPLRGMFLGLGTMPPTGICQNIDRKPHTRHETVMKSPLRHLIRTGLCLFGALALSTAASAAILGTPPSYIPAQASTPPNSQAITTMIWAPGLNDGFVPQGITYADGHLLVSSYQSDNPKVGGGPCRIYQLDPRTGRTTGRFDLPPTVRHAGGIVYAGKGMLIVSDTRRLYRIDLARAFADGNSEHALQGTISLGGAVKGSFVDFRQGSVLTGAYDKKAEGSKVFYLPYALFDRKTDTVIDERAATRSFSITPMAQGAAFDAQGYLWLAFSNSKHGLVQKVDPVSGKVLEQHTMVNGIEDMGFDPQGGLWAVSEAGSPRLLKWKTIFPIVFRMDVSKLR